MGENIAADIPQDLSTADDVLTKYGRWAAGRPTRHRCGSAEREYRPDGWHAIEDRRAPMPVGMTPAEALTAQRALARVPEPERVVLAVLYVPHRMPAVRQLQIMRIPPRLSRERHLRGLRMFANLLAAR